MFGGGAQRDRGGDVAGGLGGHAFAGIESGREIGRREERERAATVREVPGGPVRTVEPAEAAARLNFDDPSIPQPAALFQASRIESRGAVGIVTSPSDVGASADLPDRPAPSSPERIGVPPRPKTCGSFVLLWLGATRTAALGGCRRMTWSEIDVRPAAGLPLWGSLAGGG